MEVEAIIIDGKKYVPKEGKRCIECALCHCDDCEDECPCDIFGRFDYVLQEVKEEQTKNK